MSFLTKMSEKYPSVNWDGGSSIHASVCGTVGNVSITSMATEDIPKGVIAKLFASEYANHLYEKLTSTFNQFEYLITRREFTVLCLDDTLRHIHSQGDLMSDSKLINPATGNVFNLIARDGELAAGIRFWIIYGTQHISVLYRFRVVSMVENKSETHTRIKLVCDEALTNLSLVGLNIDMTEPPPISEPILLKVEEL